VCVCPSQPQGATEPAGPGLARRFATGATSLMMTGGTKELFQTVVGPRQIGHVITVKQAWPVAPVTFRKCCENASDLPGPPRFPAHAPQQISIAPTNRGTGLFLQVVENRRSTMDEAEVIWMGGHIETVCDKP